MNIATDDGNAFARHKLVMFLISPARHTIDIGRWLVSKGFKPEFIKMDCEGSEIVLLNSILSVLNFKCAIAFETHSSEAYSICRDALAKHGYRIEPDNDTVGICYAL